MQKEITSAGINEFSGISQLDSYIDKTVLLSGWVQSIRIQKKIQFIILRDHTDVIQITNFNSDLVETIKELTPESVIRVRGKVVANSHVKLRGLEIVPESIELLNRSEELPIQEDSGIDHRLNWRFLDLRNPKNRLIFEVQTLAEQAMREYWLENDFLEIHSPKIMGTASESGAELFKLDYFGKDAYLAQSPQFYKQMAMSAGLNRVFEIGPVFRADPSFTARHATEFVSVDAELSWIDSHEDVMKSEENWIHYVLKRIKESPLNKKIEELTGMEVVVPTLPFPQIKHATAIQMLQDAGYQPALEGMEDLDTEGERIVSRLIKEEYGHEFVFITDYPTSVRPFYHMRYENNPGLTKSFDLLWKGLEVTSGAQREHRYDTLCAQAIEKGLNLEPMQSYLDCFKFGCPPHGGFGFGLSRMLMLLLGFKNIREVTYIYRGPNRINP